MRSELRLQRSKLGPTYGTNAAKLLSDRFFKHFDQTLEGCVVAGYWPMKGEIDIRRVINELVSRAAITALPVTVGRDKPLVFRRWAPGDRLFKGDFEVFEPDPRLPTIVPDIVVVPILGFDAAGNRLGYGGGYYDRTLAALRITPGILAVGVAYDEQECNKIPVDAKDMPLDIIFTTRRTISPDREGNAD